MTARLLALKGIIAATDHTFSFRGQGPSSELVGKCIMCRRKKIAWAHQVWSPVFTVEHIQPRHHGGRDTISNLGLACESCNHRKGRKVDNLKENDPQRLMAVERLLTERRERLRTPVPDRRFGVWVPEVAGWAEKDPDWMHLELQWGKRT